MNRREAKRKACHFAWRILDGHVNSFLYEEESQADTDRLGEAWNELMDELFRRGRQQQRVETAFERRIKETEEAAKFALEVIAKSKPKPTEEPIEKVFARMVKKWEER